MKVHLITIFPESFNSYFSSSIIGRAKEKGFFSPFFYKLNDFSDKKYKQVDDKAYGMHGQVLSPKPLSKAIEYIFDKVGKKIPVVFMSPRGDLLTQEKLESYYKILDGEFIVICGHYEGIDQRIIDIYVDYEISIGNYVISSGELASQVFLDALVRNIPNVLGNSKSLIEDSFSKKFNRQKEYPIYTRPNNFLGRKVPHILVSGNHEAIENWKRDNLKV
ncbi:tRNA (guanosine(37)-N1)-methyltransferase TrmD [Candidatus Gracilibacteria bacterium]|nr:MAG: tRNA (guanosine(37)-N1)-methyltransferase TrmD [Candidatus Gracilibacteria bacterium]PIE85042.1 MAG: tRNA (guanosine(37)-N1)-methyltransferase TrmD [Candidatus Gracilibacteria bacterium]